MAARTARGRSFVGEAFPVRLSDADRQADGSVVSSIQLARVGTWEHPKYGTLEFTVDRFRRYIANFDANVRKVELHIDIGHDGDLKGAAGWFVPGTMRIGDTPDGPGLFVDARWTPKGIGLVRDEEYNAQRVRPPRRVARPVPVGFGALPGPAP